MPWAWRDWVLTPEADRAEERAAADEAARSTPTGPGNLDLTGYDVEAVDGGIGSIDEASTETGASSLVVDTGPWIFGRKVLLPAGTVHRVDHAERKVYVDRTKDQIKDSPEYDPDTFGKPDYRDRVGQYYEDTYRTSPPMI
jgi:hypothetical protein